MQIIKLNVEGMSCGHCVNAVKKSVSALSGVASVEVSLQDKLVTVSFDSNKVSIEQIKNAIDEQGYEVK